MNFLADVGIGGSGAGVGASHLAIADGGEEHSHHGDQDGGDDVAASVIADDAKDAHRRDGLNDDDANDDEVPEAEDATESYRRWSELGRAAGHHSLSRVRKGTIRGSIFQPATVNSGFPFMASGERYCAVNSRDSPGSNST